MSQSSKSSALLVRFQSWSIQYPEICPVCGEIATDKAKIIQSQSLKDVVPRIDHIRRLKPTDSTQLRVPCCQKHYYSATEMSKIDSINGMLSGLSVFAVIFLSAYIPASWLLQTTLPPVIYSIYLFLTLIMIVSLRSLGPSNLEKAISIMYFENETQTLILKIKNKWYYDELIRLNPFITL